MKIILTIFIIIVALFGGGCVIMVGGHFGLFVLLPFGIFALNCWLLYGVWGAHNPWRPTFFVVGFIDLLLAVGFAFLVTTIGLAQPSNLLLLVPLPIVFASKGVLSLIYAWNADGA